ELLRADSARARREQAAAALEPPDPEPAPGADDTLALLMLCCHPALTRPSQVALTLRAVGGLSTAEIARAFLVPEATIGQRISRAKARIKAEGARFRDPPPEGRPDRLAAVLEVLYLIFNEGYTASEGVALHRVELTSEAIRLTRQLHDEVPRDDPQTGEVAGLLALMLLTDARRPARQDAEGRLVPLAEQDRGRWDAAAIAEGTALLAAVHAEARRAEDTDWPQILALYGVLSALAPGPVVTLNEIVAIAMVDGPQEALVRLAAAEPALAGYHRVHAVQAHLLEQAGDRDGA